MRIIAGRFKGHRLQAPRGNTTRPTADSVREAVFNLLWTRISIDGARVLDLFCGTGAFGLEAISRGATEAVFIDTSRQALKTAASNARTLGVESACSFLQHDGLRYLRDRTEFFDIVFADPPYSFERIEQIPGRAVNVLHPGGILVLEHDKRRRLDDVGVEGESRSYGRTIVSIFRASSTMTSKQSELE